MIDQIINQWMDDYINLNSDENDSYVAGIISNENIMSALYSYLEDVNIYKEVINIVEICDIIFKHYRSDELKLKIYVLQFIPQIVYAYLNAVAHSDEKVSHVIETLVLSIYNLEIVDENGQPNILSFRLPSLAQSSVFHEPVSLAPTSLTKSALKRLELQEFQNVRHGSLHPVNSLTAQNRMFVLSELLYYYNKKIFFLPKFSIGKMCDISLKLISQGFSKNLNGYDNFRNENSVTKMPRIFVSSSFLCQLLYSLYFAMFNGFKYEAKRAVEVISDRASYQGLNDVILLTNAIKNCTLLLNVDKISKEVI